MVWIPSRSVGQRVMGAVREVGGSIVMPALISAVLGVSVLSDSKDAVGSVARVLPSCVARSLVRDSRAAWQIFTAFEAASVWWALLVAKAQREGLSRPTAGRALAAAYAEAQPVRRQVSATCAVEVLHDDRPSCVVFVPGGSWAHADDARLYRLLAANMATALHVAVAVVEYTPYPMMSGETMVDDVGRAIEWAASAFTTVVVVGHSAGAHLVASTLLRTPQEVDAVVLLSGVYDLDAHLAHETKRGVAQVSALSGAFASPRVRARFSPSRQLNPRLAPRVALIHGADDTTVPVASTLDFAARLAPRVTTRVLSETDHFDLLYDGFLSAKDAPLFELIRPYLSTPAAD